jgi:hypothetical protein
MMPSHTAWLLEITASYTNQTKAMITGKHKPTLTKMRSYEKNILSFWTNEQK